MLKRAKLLKIIVKAVVAAGVVWAAIFLNGCTMSGAPRVRLGSYATSTPGTNFIDTNSLGRHSYSSFLLENNGLHVLSS